MQGNISEHQRTAATAEEIAATNTRGERLTTEPTPTQVDSRPEFCRPGQMPQLFGISRTATYLYLADGSIKGVNLRRPGCATGIRLIDCESVRRFLAQHFEAPADRPKE